MLAIRRRCLGLIAALSIAIAPFAGVSAHAANGFDSAFAGESAFVTLGPGESAELTVFFQNAGTVPWVVGTPTQVDLAACLDDKVTCDVVPEEAAWNPGGTKAWRSGTRYATHTQPSVAPGAIATFTYSVKVPSGATARSYRLNGDLIVSATGAKVHAEGYFHEATVIVPVAVPVVPIVVKPTLVGASSRGVSEILVTFSANMSCASLAAGTYVIKDAGGNVIDSSAPAGGTNQITASTISTSGSGALDCKTVTLYLRESTSAALGRGSIYTLQVTGVTDASGTSIDTAANSASFTGADLTGPTLTALVFLSPSLVRAVYSEPMTSSSVGAGITNPANYRIDGTSGTTAFSSCVLATSGLAADCTLAAAFSTASRGDHTLTATEVTDISGNLISPNPSMATATYPASLVRPTIAGATSPSISQVVVTFDRVLNQASTGSGCANLSNYTITKADGTGSGVSLSSVTCAANQVTLGLGGATSGAGYVLVITGLSELFGSIVDPNPASVSFSAATDTTRPTALTAVVPAQLLACDVSSPAPCQRSQFTVTFSEPMTQGTGAGGVSNTAAYLLKDASGAAASLTSCSAVNSRNTATSGSVTCILSRPVPAGSYTLTIGSSSAPTDIAGNALNPASFTVSFR